MTVTTGPEISITDLTTELNLTATNEASMDDAIIGNMIDSAVWTSGGEHELDDWYGAINGIGYLGFWGTTTYTKTDVSVGPNYSEVQLSVNDNGLFSINLYEDGDLTLTTQEAWNDGDWDATAYTGYQVKWTKVSGADPDNTNMTVNTWYTLTAQFIYVRATTDTNVNGVYDVTIRQSGDVWSEVVQRFDFTADYTVPISIGGDWPVACGNWPDYFGASNGTAYWDFRSTGEMYAEGNGSTLYDYLNQIAAGNGDDFWVKHVKSSGDSFNYGNAQTDDNYYQLNATRTFGHSVVSSGARTWTGTVYIAEDASGTGAVSKACSLVAEKI